MLVSPEQYSGAPVYELLQAAARGEAGIDQRLLHAILDRGEDAIPDLVRFGLESPAEGSLPLADHLLHMFRHLRTPKALPFLAHYARGELFDFSSELTEAFVELGEAAVEPLLELYEESAAPDVSFTLAALGVRDARILELLTRELKTAPLEAAISLARYGDPAARPALEEALAAADDPDVRREIERAIEDIGRAEPAEPLPAFNIWELYPEEEPPHFFVLGREQLAEFLSSPAAEYRAQAAEALRDQTWTGEIRSRVFQLAQKDPEPRVRAACWESLTEALEDPDVRAAMMARLEDAAAPLEERCGALVALASEAGEPAIRRRILEFYARPEARAKAVEAMWRSFDRRFGEYIPRHLDDPDPEVREQAVIAAGWLGLSAQVGRIEKLFDDEELRETALYSYVLAAPGETTPARMRKLLGKIEQLAGGLSEVEARLVANALDNRLALHGYGPVFLEEEPRAEDEHEGQAAAPDPARAKAGRNDPCPCGSGKKYKKCCGKS